MGREDQAARAAGRFPLRRSKGTALRPAHDGSPEEASIQHTEHSTRTERKGGTTGLVCEAQFHTYGKMRSPQAEVITNKERVLRRAQEKTQKARRRVRRSVGAADEIREAESTGKAEGRA